jgi:hypothetical protein
VTETPYFPDSPNARRVFDRVPFVDPANADFPMSAEIEPIVRTQKIWTPALFRLDQGWEGACVGNGVTNEMLATPVRVDLTTARLPAGAPRTPQEFASWLYHEAQKIDPWPGGEYVGADPRYSGTSVLAGMKKATQAGFYSSYYWAYSVDPVIGAIIQKGPVVLGMNWRSGMYEAPGGWLRVEGEIVGGHCLVAIGYKPLHLFPDGTIGEAIKVLNSWGRSWGKDGMAWIKKADFADWIADDGEACLPLGRHYMKPSVTSLSLWARMRRAVEFGSRPAQPQV